MGWEGAAFFCSCEGRGEESIKTLHLHRQRDRVPQSSAEPASVLKPPSWAKAQRGCPPTVVILRALERLLPQTSFGCLVHLPPERRPAIGRPASTAVEDGRQRGAGLWLPSLVWQGGFKLNRILKSKPQRDYNLFNIELILKPEHW